MAILPGQQPHGRCNRCRCCCRAGRHEQINKEFLTVCKIFLNIELLYGRKISVRIFFIEKAGGNEVAARVSFLNFVAVRFLRFRLTHLLCGNRSFEHN